MNATTTPRLPARKSLGASLRALASYDFFPAFSAKVRRLLYNPLGILILVALAALLCGAFLHPQGFVLRRLTVMYYFRVLTVRWLEPPDYKAWVLDLDTATSSGECVQMLLAASVVFTLIGAVLMMRKEFRMKTPEGS